MAKGIRIRLEYEDWLIISFLAGIGAGTLLVNLLGSPIQEEAGYVGQLYEAAARIGQNSPKTFFMAVFRQRMGGIIILWFMGLTVFSEKCFCLAALWAGLSSSAVLSVMVCQKGISGFFCYLAAVFPQALFYIPAWLLAAAAGSSLRKNFPVKMAVSSLGLTAAGISCEVILNPFFIRVSTIFQ